VCEGVLYPAGVSYSYACCAVCILLSKARPYSLRQYQDRRFCSYKDVVWNCLFIFNTDIQHAGIAAEVTYAKGWLQFITMFLM